jgi:hypothetical protein
VVAVASEDMRVNVGSAGHSRFKYVMLDCALTAPAKSDATMALRIVATGAMDGERLWDASMLEMKSTVSRACARRCTYLS